MTHNRKFNSIKSNIFNHLDSMTEAHQRLLKLPFVSNPWLFCPFLFLPSLLANSSSVCRDCSVLASPYTSLSPLFPASLCPWEEYRSSKGNKCAPAAGWEDWVYPSTLSLALSLPLSRPVCLLLVQENQRRSSPLQPCLRGVWLQRKESEEVCGGILIW